jgi:hypothetical protein
MHIMSRYLIVVYLFDKVKSVKMLITYGYSPLGAVNDIWGDYEPNIMLANAYLLE